MSDEESELSSTESDTELSGVDSNADSESDSLSSVSSIFDLDDAYARISELAAVIRALRAQLDLASKDLREHKRVLDNIFSHLDIGGFEDW